MIIGLTGKYCAGKNFIASLLEKRGFPVLDVDKLGYKALEIEKEAIYVKFAQDFNNTHSANISTGSVSASYTTDTPLDRKLLGQIVFGNPEKLAALEAIIHPVANRLTDEWIAEQNGHCVINAALLHRSSIFKQLDRIILVKAPFFTRLLRARRRDKLPWRDLLKRFKSQKDFNTQYLSKNAEIYRIGNPSLFSGTLESQIEMFLKGI